MDNNIKPDRRRPTQQEQEFHDKFMKEIQPRLEAAMNQPTPDDFIKVVTELEAVAKRNGWVGIAGLDLWISESLVLADMKEKNPPIADPLDGNDQNLLATSLQATKDLLMKFTLKGQKHG